MTLPQKIKFLDAPFIHSCRLFRNDRFRPIAVISGTGTLLGMRWVLSAMFAIGCTASMGVAQVPPGTGEVLIRERLWPTDVAKSASGRCGKNLYRIEVRHNGDTHTLLLEVNGRPVAKSEVEKVTQSVLSGLRFYEPSIAECFWDNPNGRMRLMAGGPGSSEPLWLSFEVSPDGLVSNIRPD